MQDGSDGSTPIRKAISSMPTMYRHGCAFYLTFDRKYSVDEVKDYFWHTTIKMIEKVYALLRAEKKRQKISEVIYDFISDSYMFLMKRGHRVCLH